MSKKKKKLDRNIIEWLKREKEEAQNESWEYKCRAEEFDEALERYATKGSLPKDIRYEYNQWLKHWQEEAYG